MLNCLLATPEPLYDVNIPTPTHDRRMSGLARAM